MKLPALTASNNRIHAYTVCRDYVEMGLSMEEIALKNNTSVTNIANTVYRNRKALTPDPDYWRAKRLSLLSRLNSQLSGRINKNRDAVDLYALMQKEFSNDNISAMMSGLPNFNVSINLGEMATLGHSLKYIDPDKVIDVTTDKNSYVISNPTPNIQPVDNNVIGHSEAGKVDVDPHPSNCVENVQVPQTVSKQAKRPAGRMSEIQRNRLAERLAAMREGRPPAIKRKAKNLGAAQTDNLGLIGT